MTQAGEVPELLSPRNVATGLVLVCVPLGVLLHAPLLLALGEVTMVALALSLLLVRLQMHSLSAERSHPATAFEGTTIPVTLVLRGLTGLGAGYVEIASPFPASIAPPRSFLLTRPLRRGERHSLSHEVVLDRPRGRYEIGPLVATVTDPFGFWRRRFQIPVRTSITVYPATFTIGHLPLRGTSASHHVGQRTTARSGASEYFFGTREYRRGDPLRLIHWASSAHRRRLIVKEFELSVATEVTIFIDLERAKHRGLGRASTLERAVTIAGSVAGYGLKAGHAVGLVGEGAERLFVPHGGGSRQLPRILEALTRAQADGSMSLPEVLRAHVPRITRESSVVVIWNGLEIDYRDYEVAFEVLREHSVKPVAIFIDDSTFIRRERGVELDDAQGRGERALSLARAEERARMSRAGIDVHVVPGDRDPATAFRMPVYGGRVRG